MKSLLRNLGMLSLSVGLAASAASPARAVSTTLVVNEVMHGDSHSANHEFLEVRNISDQDVHVDLFEIRFQGANFTTGEPSTTVTTMYTFPVGSMIPAGGYFLIASSTFAAHDDHKALPINGIYSVETATLSTRGGVGIFDRQGNRVDSVAYGSPVAASHPMVETTPVDAFASGQSIERTDSADTDNNFADFAVPFEGPSPTSTPWTPNVPGVQVTVTPPRLDKGQTAQVSVLATPFQGTVTGVTMDLSPLGGAVDAPLTNASGNTWTGSFTVPAGQAPGPLTLVVRADESTGKYGTGGADLFVYPGPPITVAQAREAEPNTGAIVRVRGIVMSKHTGYVYITDPGTNAGIAVADGNQRDSVAPLEAGDDVTVTGTITRAEITNTTPPTIRYQGERVLETATKTPADIELHSQGNPVPEPLAITLNDLVNDQSLTGKLVSVPNVSIVKAPQQTAASTGDNVQHLQVVDWPTVYIGVSRSATDVAFTPYPGKPAKPIPAISATNFYVPWVAVNDAFNVRGIVGRTSQGYTTNASTGPFTNPAVIRVRDATDLILTNGAKYVSGGSVPGPAEQGMAARIRVVAYPVDTATVSVNLAPIGLGTVSLPADAEGTYSAVVNIPAGAPLGNHTISATVAANGQTAPGTFTLTVAVPTLNPGDVDRSGGAPNLEDVRLALRAAAGLQAADGAALSVANGDVFPKGAPDGALTLGDAARILRAVSGLETL